MVTAREFSSLPLSVQWLWLSWEERRWRIIQKRVDEVRRLYPGSMREINELLEQREKDKARMQRELDKVLLRPSVKYQKKLNTQSELKEATK